MHGRGHAWQGGICGREVVHGKGASMAFMLPSIPGRYYEIRSMSGRYASYWNAFLLLLF